MDYTTITLQKEDGVATITLNRPERLNALNMDMSRELVRASEDIKKDDAVKVVIVTGAGRAFCAGADLESSLFDNKNPADLSALIRHAQTYILNLRRMPKPVIAAVNGAAIGVGCDFVLACDIIYVSEKARFGEVFVSRAIHPDCGSSYFLSRLVGTGKACELIFTGKIIDAHEAEKIGIANHVVPPEQLESITRELALSLARGATFAIGLSKLSIYQAWTMDLTTALEAEIRAQTMCFLSEDSNEGAKSFLEKRPPEFKGR